MEERKKGLVSVAVALCAVMLLLTAGMLITRLLPQSHSMADGVPDADAPDGGTLGMVLLDITDADTAFFYHVRERGVYVLAVEESSEAYDAGVRSGDRIVSANTVALETSSDLTALQTAMRSSDLLTLEISRGTQEHRLIVVLRVNAEGLTQGGRCQ